MYSNNPLILQLISLLKQFGINKIVVSPGGRHVQLVLSLEQDSDFELYSVVDERSAAFFALGLIQTYNEPVAVACSSGTACMNYGSALAEAYYQRLPLLVLSADRLPALLNQGEEQMYNQLDPFRTITKCQVQLPEVRDDIDFWHCNRLINEALLELTNHGNGPVQINFPMRDIFGNGFETKELPLARKINLHTADCELEAFANRLNGKKVMLVWGQSVPTKGIEEAVKSFSECNDLAILTDCIANCQNKDAIRNTFVILQTLSEDLKKGLQPDIVISIGGNQVFNGEIKQFLKNHDFEHWVIGPQNKVCDPYQKLTEIFEMNEAYFFERISSHQVKLYDFPYKKAWMEVAKLPEPDVESFNEVKIIGDLIHRLPKNCNLQLANSNTIRIASYFKIPSSIEVHCNRGVNGIDGSMSTAIGFSSAQNELTFYISGELSFFYDMNSLWIKHVTPQLRILLINNDGGAFMYSQRRIINGKPSLTLAADNHISAEGWAKSAGFKYLHAESNDSYINALDEFISKDSKRPIILEVDTIMRNDRIATDEYIRSMDKRTIMDKIHGRIRNSRYNIFKGK